jgi:hypothetical protein
MNIGFLVAGILCVIGVLAHGIGGEYTLRRVPTSAFPQIPNGGSQIAKQEVRMSWHGVTVIFLLSAVTLLLMAFTDVIVDQVTIAHGISIVFIGFALDIMIVPLIATRQLSTLARIPQWILCFVIAGATLAGLGG